MMRGPLLSRFFCFSRRAAFWLFGHRSGDEIGKKLADYLLRPDFAGTDACVEFFDRRKAEFFDLAAKGGGLERFFGFTITAKFKKGLDELAFTTADIFVAEFFFEPDTDLALGAGTADDLEPVATRAFLVLAGENRDDIAVLQAIFEWHYMAVDLGSDAAMADIGMNRVAKSIGVLPLGNSITSPFGVNT